MASRSGRAIRAPGAVAGGDTGAEPHITNLAQGSHLGGGGASAAPATTRNTPGSSRTHSRDGKPHDAHATSLEVRIPGIGFGRGTSRDTGEKEQKPPRTVTRVKANLPNTKRKSSVVAVAAEKLPSDGRSVQPEKGKGRVGPRELGDLGFWTIKEISTSRSTRAARGRVAADAEEQAKEKADLEQRELEADETIVADSVGGSVERDFKPTIGNGILDHTSLPPRSSRPITWTEEDEFGDTIVEDSIFESQKEQAATAAYSVAEPINTPKHNYSNEPIEEAGRESKRQKHNIANRELKELETWTIKQSPVKEKRRSRTRSFAQESNSTSIGETTVTSVQPNSGLLRVASPLQTLPRSLDKSAKKATDFSFPISAATPVRSQKEGSVVSIISTKPIPRYTGDIDHIADPASRNTFATVKTSSSKAPFGTAQKISQNPWPRSQRFKHKDPLPENVICVSSFLSDEDIRSLMPDLDEAVLTRARRRAEGPRAERLMSRRASSSHAEVIGVRRNSVANGVRAVSVLRSPAPTTAINGSSTTNPPLTTTVHIDLTQPSESSSGSKAQQPGPKDAPKRKKEEKPLERNIDNVVFGDISFKAWYPSWYPKEIIGEKGFAGDTKGIVVSDLYVCKRCFAYAKVPVDWVRHTACCEKDLPGEKIYTHDSEGAWSIWEVDGDVDTLFCQNLSLFAKLFLDNKSVFFDVSGFKYFLLVHTRTIPPHPSSPPSTQPQVQNQVVGFFSKEKMSWDNNNLACILIFPPWQKKSLGTLLMGISYAISRRERVLGGPEKPISELGRKGYKRFWGGEIARWLLEQKESDRKGRGGVVSVADVSLGTWIVVDDCLGVLRDMGVVERIGKGKEGEERVRIDKQKVREWVGKMGICLDRVVDEVGFVEGYAVVEDEEEEEAEGEGEEEEEDVIMDDE